MLIFFIIIILVILFLFFTTYFSQKRKNNNKQNPTFLISSNEEIGNYLTDCDGRALYCFAGGKRNKIENSNTNPLNASEDNQLGIWQIFYKKKIILPAFLGKKEFSTVIRQDGQKQLAYRGYPLYYYGNDLNPGEVKGEGINNAWFTIKMD